MYWWREAGLHTEILPGGGIWIWTKEGAKEVFHPTHARERVTMTHPKYSSGKS